MDEATGQAGLMNIMLTIIGIIIVLMAGSISYSKAFRVKNKIIDVIETKNGFNEDARNEIENSLLKIGYRFIDNSKINSYCPNDKFSGFSVVSDIRPNYLYCIYKKNENEATYYKVLAYMYFDLPVIGNYIEIPVSGETKIIYDKDSDKIIK